MLCETENEKAAYNNLRHVDFCVIIYETMQTCYVKQTMKKLRITVYDMLYEIMKEIIKN
jgi:hypothetical protein